MTRKTLLTELDIVARQARHEFWRDTYRAAFYRRLIGTCLSILFAAIFIWVLIALAFSVQP